MADQDENRKEAAVKPNMGSKQPELRKAREYKYIVPSEDRVDIEAALAGLQLLTWEEVQKKISEQVPQKKSE